MTNDDTILREVDQALAQDQTSQSFQKNLPAIIAAAAIVVVGVGGWQFWNVQHRAAAEKASAVYDEALKSADETKSTEALTALADESGGYAALANMRLAGERATHGDREAALGLYREVYGSGAGSKRLKDMARLRAAYLSMADGRDAVIKDIGALETDKTAIGFYAREILALAALKAGDYQSAEQMFRKAASAPDAPESIRLRGAEFAALAGAGKAGVELPVIEESQKSETERYLETLEEASGDLSSVLKPGTPAPEETVAPEAGAVSSDAPPSNEPADPEGNE